MRSAVASARRTMSAATARTAARTSSWPPTTARTTSAVASRSSSISAGSVASVERVARFSSATRPLSHRKLDQTTLAHGREWSDQVGELAEQRELAIVAARDARAGDQRRERDAPADDTLRVGGRPLVRSTLDLDAVLGAPQHPVDSAVRCGRDSHQVSKAAPAWRRASRSWASLRWSSPAPGGARRSGPSRRSPRDPGPAPERTADRSARRSRRGRAGARRRDAPRPRSRAGAARAPRGRTGTASSSAWGSDAASRSRREPPADIAERAAGRSGHAQRDRLARAGDAVAEALHPPPDGLLVRAHAPAQLAAGAAVAIRPPVGGRPDLGRHHRRAGREAGGGLGKRQRHRVGHADRGRVDSRDVRELGEQAVPRVVAVAEDVALAGPAALVG